MLPAPDPSLRMSRAELARLDRIAAGEFGLPTAVLMENAGRGAAEEVLAMFPGSGARVAVFAGPGNNGGDACVLARHLANAGVGVEVLASTRAENLRGDAAIMRRAVERAGIVVHDLSGIPDASTVDAIPGEILVDGLLGTGFRGEMRPGIAALVEAVHRRRQRTGALVVALDLPSGLDADTGRPARPTVVADLTITFAALKVGFDAPEAKPFLGRVVVAGIGVRAEIVRGSPS